MFRRYIDPDHGGGDRVRAGLEGRKDDGAGIRNPIKESMNAGFGGKH